MLTHGDADLSDESTYQKWLETEGIPVIRDFFLQDIRKVALARKRKGGFGVYLNLIGTGEANDAYVCEISPGECLNAERHLFEEMIFVVHGPGAHVIIIAGKGYSLMWPEGSPIEKFEWEESRIVVPPANWFHQHFNTGDTPARYLALRWGTKKYRGVRKAYGVDEDVKKGGSQIEYHDEDPGIHHDFETALEQSGARCAMGNHHPRCSQREAA